MSDLKRNQNEDTSVINEDEKGLAVYKIILNLFSAILTK